MHIERWITYFDSLTKAVDLGYSIRGIGVRRTDESLRREKREPNARIFASAQTSQEFARKVLTRSI